MTEKKLRLNPFYTGDEILDEVLRNKKSLSMLWLEILLNDQIPWELYLEVPEIKVAYEKACIWYSNFRTMVDNNTWRKLLKILKGKVDEREFREFLEALNFVA